jgi:ribosome modulation factor
MTTTLRISIEFEEGYAAYGDGVDGYAAKPYPDLTQEMTDWFAGWIAARNDDKAEVAA